MTPVKSSITTRRSVLTPQKKQSDPNSTVTTESTKLTPRKARYQRFQQLAQLKESKRSNKENVRENVETGTPEEADEEPTEKVTPASQDEEKEEVKPIPNNSRPNSFNGIEELIIGSFVGVLRCQRAPPEWSPWRQPH